MQRLKPAIRSRKVTLALSLGTLLLVLSPQPVQAAPGDPDLSFGTDGKVTTNIGTGFSSAKALALQADGRIVVAGSAPNNAPQMEDMGHQGGNNDDFGIVRYNSDGTLDNTFGTDGRVTTTFGHNDIASAVAIQADGKIVAAGSNNHVFLLGRYSTDGTLDPTFGAGGQVITDSGFNGDKGNGVVIQPDGKIVIAGYAETGTTNIWDFFLARYNSDGSLDTTFGGDGTVRTDFNNNFDVAQSIALQPDGKIVVAGWSEPLFGSDPLIGANDDIALARYNPDGTLDFNFGMGGKVITDSGSDDFAFALRIQPDGKIVIAGDFYDGTDRFFSMWRYNSDGSLDTGFGTGGQILNNFSSSCGGGMSLDIQANGKIVTIQCQVVARYQSDGSLDNMFGTNGRVNIDFSGSAIALQTDGKIVVAGISNDDQVVARFLGDAVLNNPPSIPELVFPRDGQTGLGTTVNFGWLQSTDPDGDAVTYDFSYCENDSFTGCDPVNVSSLGHKGIFYAGLGAYGAGLLLFGIIGTGSIRGRRKRGLLIVATLMAGMLFVSCGSDGNPSDVSYTVSGLSPSTTYYWKVVADDGKGGTTESEIRSFNTK